jgi:hypothetical protein
MTKPTFPALVALLIIWAMGAIAFTALYLISRVASGHGAARPVVTASTLAPIFEEPTVIDPPKVHRTRKPRRPTLAAILKSEAIA